MYESKQIWEREREREREMRMGEGRRTRKFSNRKKY
jgi:hypothetical protein